MISVLAALQLLILILGYAGYARTGEVEANVINVEDSIVLEE